MSKNKLKIRDDYEWHYFTTSYLEIAALACNEIINKKYTKYYRYDKSGELLKEDKILHQFGIKELYIPIIFNIKHS